MFLRLRSGQIHKPSPAIVTKGKGQHTDTQCTLSETETQIQIYKLFPRRKAILQATCNTHGMSGTLPPGAYFFAKNLAVNKHPKLQ